MLRDADVPHWATLRKRKAVGEAVEARGSEAASSKRQAVAIDESALPPQAGIDAPMWDHVVARGGSLDARPMGMGGGSRKRHITPLATQARRVAARAAAEADAASRESLDGRLVVRASCGGPSPVEGVLARIRSRLAGDG